MSRTWDVERLLQGKTRDQIIDDAEALIGEIEEYKEQLSHEEPDTVKKIFDLRCDVQIALHTVGSYDALRVSENMGNKQARADQSSLGDIASRFGIRTMFFTQWIKHLEDDEFQKLRNSEVLQEYQYALDRIRSGVPFMLSDEAEEAVTIKDNALSQLNTIYDVLNTQITYDMEEEKNLTREEIGKYRESTNPEKREEAYDVFHSTFQEYKDVFSEIYVGVVKDWSQEALELRNYKSPLHVRTHSQDIPVDAVENMLDVVRNNIEIYHDFFSLHDALLHEDGKEFEYDRRHIYAPLETTDAEYEFEESLELVLDVYESFSPRFAEILEDVAEKRVHSHPQEGKRNGAFCLGPHTQASPYVMLNHTDDLNSLFVMAHEFGHAVHFELSKGQKQPYYDAVLPLAETASVFGEMLLADRLLEDADESEKKAVLVRLLKNTFATIPRQAYFILFEIQAHDKILNGGSQDDLDDIYWELLEEQFGDMKIPDHFRVEWNALPHMHQTPFYCYAYTWGNLLTLALYDIYKE